jgi:hypothetical protein
LKTVEEKPKWDSRIYRLAKMINLFLDADRTAAYFGIVAKYAPFRRRPEPMRLLLRLPLCLGLSLFLVPGQASPQAPRPAGIKMTVRYSSIGQESEQTTYFRADARRVEYRNVSGSHYGPHLAFIERCDLGERFGLNLDQHEYDSYPYPPQLSKEQLARMTAQAPPPAQPGPPTFRIEETTVDTGERKDFFGHQARHVITTRRETPLAGSRHYAKDIVTDGWYIDLDAEISCEPWWRSSKQQKGIAYLRAGNDPLERVELVQKGNAEHGFALDLKVVDTSFFVLHDGTTRASTSKSRTTVIDFLDGPLTPGIFEVPAGFTKVERINWNQPEEERSAFSARWQAFVLMVEDLLN